MSRLPSRFRRPANGPKRREGPIRAAIYGACHADGLRRMLESDSRCSAAIEFVPLVECFRMTEEELAEFEASVAPTLDLFIFQPVTALSLGERYSASAVTSHLRPDCVKIAFQYAHLELYTPFHNYPDGALPRAPFDYLDFEIAGQYLHGVRESDVAAALASRSLDDAVVHEIARWSIEELAAREFGDTGPVDIEITSVVRERFENEVLFHTINHPAPPVMNHIVERTIDLMTSSGLLDDSVAHDSPIDPFGNIHIPAHPAVQRVLGLTDDSAFVYKGRPIAEDEVIHETYAYLDALDRAQITASFDRLTAARPWFEAAL